MSIADFSQKFKCISLLCCKFNIKIKHVRLSPESRLHILSEQESAPFLEFCKNSSYWLLLMTCYETNLLTTNETGIRPMWASKGHARGASNLILQWSEILWSLICREAKFKAGQEPHFVEDSDAYSIDYMVDDEMAQAHYSWRNQPMCFGSRLIQSCIVCDKLTCGPLLC